MADTARTAHLQRRFGGYFRSHTPAIDRELVEVAPGTPGGEYLRRTWQPVCLTQEIGELPKPVTMLGEDLVIFRTKAGEIGLLDRYCSHRGTSLEYGLTTDQGIVCCYHGWHFAVDGEILDTPNDPTSRAKEKLCHAAYPTYEYRGIVFAYMGPPDGTPDFPLFDSYDQPDTEMVPFSLHFPCNWVQVLDNTQDPIHSCFLHTRVSGVQFSESWGELPVLQYLETPLGMINLNVRRWKDQVWVRTTDVMLPNMNQTGALWLTADDEERFLGSSLTRWMRPIDDVNTQMIGWRYFNHALDRAGNGNKSQVGVGKIDFVGQTEDERPYKERQRFPGDYEAIAGSGPIAHSQRWNLNKGDQGVTMLRRIIKQNIEAVRDGSAFKAPEQATKVDGYVPTYTRDTVVVRPQTDKDESDLLKAFGERVWALTQQTLEVPHSDRVAQFTASLPGSIDDLMTND
ncbi:MAG: Rieske 2Fe-2S domain-containing protein [Paracoccaceae bacterium]